MTRRSALALIGGGGIMLAAGTGAYSAVSGDRGFDIGVDEDRALVGIETFTQSGEDGERIDLLTLENNFNHDFTVDRVSITNRPPASVEIEESSLEYPGQLRVTDDPQAISGVLDCQGAATADVEVTVELSSEQAGFSATRTASIQCEVPTFDPRDCQDIVGAPCDEETSGSTTIDDDKASGSVCVDGDGRTITVDTENNLSMDGFLLVENATDLTFDTGNQFTIDGAVNLYEITGDITIELGNQPSMAGDFCTSANGDITADFGPGNVPTTEFARDVKLVAGGDIDFVFGENLAINGDLVLEAGGTVDVVLENNTAVDGGVVVDAGNNATIDISTSDVEEDDIDADAGGEVEIITGEGEGDDTGQPDDTGGGN